MALTEIESKRFDEVSKEMESYECKDKLTDSEFEKYLELRKEWEPLLKKEWGGEIPEEFTTEWLVIKWNRFF